MKTYPIGSPPETAGLYILTNRKTGHIYIGQSGNLRRRYNEWKSALVCRLGVKNKRFFDAIEESVPDDWQFSILTEMPDATPEELDAAERRAIAHVSNRRPSSILNGLMPPKPSEPKKESHTAKSVILDDNECEIPYAEAAAALGVQTEGLRKRLQKYRSRGVYRISLAVLKAKSEKYLAQKEPRLHENYILQKLASGNPETT